MENTTENKDGMSIYEVSFLFLPHISGALVLEKVAKLKEKMVSLGATLISDENPILIDLAYAMTKVAGATRHKVNSAYFGWIKFETNQEGILGIQKAFEADLEVVRYLIVKTVKENTLLHGKMKLKSEEKAKKEETKEEESVEEAPEVETVEAATDLDKSIDDLVIA